MKIGSITLENPFILGPMAGITDRAFRVLCHENGAALVSMEMVSANALKYRNRKTKDMIDIDPSEHPVSLQLFGPDPDTIAYAVRAISAFPYDILDINMGCPVPKIVKNGEGSALMRDPSLAAAIVRAAVKADPRPVTVKIRRGFSENEINAVEVARAVEDAGASAVAVHGRTREQYYTGRADWDIVSAVKEAVSIPVIGNGDVRSLAEGRERMKETGCDAVMISRAARGNPWIFSGRTPAKEEICAMMRRHAEMLMNFKDERTGLLEMRKHIAWYTAGFPDSARLRKLINEAPDRETLLRLIDEFRTD